MTFGTNLFLDVEPQVSTSCITIFTYGGAPPIVNRKESSIQIRVKSSSTQKAQETAQSLINVLDRNDNVCASSPGKMFANRSAPEIYGHLEGGEYTVSIAEFTIKHITLS